ncbi:glycosyl hydrolase [Aspergillus cavernicola]|uniref:Glycosyl hydrolase n=1 Tax=Aspergillus cavernicola TaxID=176166 RepID=A0ABR4IAX6_9EURO
MSQANAATANSTYTNPILPGWHSDPSCIFVPEQDNTFFCATSSFLTFPGIPIYASKDLLNWKLASHVVTRPSQVPELAKNTTSQTQQDGLWAPTIRYHNGKFYLLTSYVSMYPDFGFTGLLFSSEDVYSSSSEAWNDPLRFEIGDIDPDIFWDDDIDSTVYITYAGVSQTTLNLETGQTGPSYALWPGTGAGLPEGPHIFKKDNWYYLCIGEGGTELGHQQSIARSRKVSGPYEAYTGNPVLTNKGTDEYFQTVGHADLFQDRGGNWWGVALATRSGPPWRVYPMGRETVLFPVSWGVDEWPVFEPVRGSMSGWELPRPGPRARTHNGDMIPGDGAYVDADDDDINFAPGSSIPSHFLFWRFPRDGAFTVSPSERPFSLRLVPSKYNITGSVLGNAESESESESDLETETETEKDPSITLLTRRQSHTYFSYSVDIAFAPREEGEEVGVSIFLTQFQHVDLGAVLLPSSDESSESSESSKKRKERKLVPHIRFRTTLLDDLNTAVTQNVTVPETVVKPLSLPSSSSSSKARRNEIQARLTIQAINDMHYTLSVTLPDPRSSCGFDNLIFEKTVEAALVSGGTGRFTGVLLGAYATSNGGSGSTPAYITGWRYEGRGQKIE